MKYYLPFDLAFACHRFDAAKRVMGEFGWGEEFFKVNRELLDAYSHCEDSEGVVKAQNEVTNIEGRITSLMRREMTNWRKGRL